MTLPLILTGVLSFGVGLLVGLLWRRSSRLTSWDVKCLVNNELCVFGSADWTSPQFLEQIHYYVYDDASTAIPGSRPPPGATAIDVPAGSSPYGFAFKPAIPEDKEGKVALWGKLVEYVAYGDKDFDCSGTSTETDCSPP